MDNAIIFLVTSTGCSLCRRFEEDGTFDRMKKMIEDHKNVLSLIEIIHGSRNNPYIPRSISKYFNIGYPRIYAIPNHIYEKQLEEESDVSNDLKIFDGVIINGVPQAGMTFNYEKILPWLNSFESDIKSDGSGNKICRRSRIYI